jgi:hypothetical protein
MLTSLTIATRTLLSPALALGMALAAGADALDPTDRLIREADLVFRGEVIGIDYALSEGAPGIPHTFVTYRVDHVFKGRVAGGGSTLTLRFTGGPRPTGGFALLEGTPLFDVGDDDVVLAEENGALACPLAGGEAGRFRVIGGRLYTEVGQAVTLVSPQAPLGFGPRTVLEDVRTNTVGPYRLERVGRIEGENPGPLPVPAVSAPAFAAWLQARIASLQTPAEQAALAPVSSLDPRQPFSIPVPSVAALR